MMSCKDIQLLFSQFLWRLYKQVAERSLNCGRCFASARNRTFKIIFTGAVRLRGRYLQENSTTLKNAFHTASHVLCENKAHWNTTACRKLHVFTLWTKQLILLSGSCAFSIPVLSRVCSQAQLRWWKFFWYYPKAWSQSLDIMASQTALLN